MLTKQKLESWLSANQAYVIFGIVIAVYSLFMNSDRMDDVSIYSGITESGPLLEWLKFRWDTWTSRVLIDGVIVLMVAWNIWIFRILNWCMWMLLVYSIADLLQIERNKQLSYILILSFLIYPFKVMGAVGWCSVGVNYVWTSALGCYAVTSYTKLNLGAAKYSMRKKIFFAISMCSAAVFAGNQEMACAILCAIFGMLWFCAYKKSNQFYQIVVGMQFILVIVELLIILTCKGNYIRKLQEAERWMPEYTEFTFLDKLSIGITDTINGLFVGGSFLCLLFAIVVCMAVFTKTRLLSLRCMALIPILFIIGTRFLPSLLEYEFSYLEDFWEYMPTPRQSEFFALEQDTIISLLMWLAVFLCLTVSVYVTCQNFQERMLYSIVLGSGLATRAVVGFSPSVYVSGSRTFYFLDVLIIFCMGYMLKKYYDRISMGKLRLLQGGMGLLAVSSVLNTLGGM